MEGGDLAIAERSHFLDSIRDRTARYRPTRSPSSVWTRTRDRQPPPAIENPLERFLEELAALGGHGQRVDDLAAARNYVVGLAGDWAARLVLRWDDEELERLAVDGPLRDTGVQVAVWSQLDDLRELAARADIGLTTADWAVAETGSISVSSGPGRGRSVALLPPTHVAILPTARVLPTLGDAIARLGAGGELPASVAFHTGPSRSGDIEMTLTVGVHGPGDVHVVLVG